MKTERPWDPEVCSLAGVVFARAAQTPDKPAFTLLRTGRAAEVVSCRELAHGVRAAAGRLQREGLERGGRVVLVFATDRASILTFYGILAAGGVPVPYPPPFSLKAGELDAYDAALDAVLRDCGATLLVAPARTMLVLRGSLERAHPGLRLLTPGPEGEGAASLPDLSPDDPALLQYTSGTTGRPKGVRLTHGNLLANAEAIRLAIDPIPEDVTVSWLPLFHDMGLIGTLITTHYGGVPLVLMRPQAFVKDPASWLRAISDHSGTITVAPNFAFHLCVQRVRSDQAEGLDLRSLRIALNGAEPVNVRAVERFHAAFSGNGLRSHVVRPVYGLAEATLAVTFSGPGPCRTDTVDAGRLERVRVAVPARAGARRRTLVSVGRPLHGVAVRIIDEHGQHLPEREVGEILVRGPSVMLGYHGQAAATAEVLARGWLRTGDLGYLADSELYVTGRGKDVIIRYGRNYDPQDLEALASEVDGVRTGSVAAFAVAGARGDGVVLVAETRLEDPAALAAAEREICRRLLRAFQFRPDEVYLVPPGVVPRTTSGKVRRRLCRERLLAGRLLARHRGTWWHVQRRVVRSAVAWLREVVRERLGGG